MSGNMNVCVEELGVCVCVCVRGHVCVQETQAEWCNMRRGDRDRTAIACKNSRFHALFP